MKTITTRVSEVTRRNDRIVEVRYKDNVMVTQADVVVMTDEYEKLCEGELHGFIIISGKYTNITKGAREYDTSEQKARFMICQAFVLRSLAQKILYNSYLKIQRPSFPTRSFTTIKEAEKWVKKQMKELEIAKQ